MIIILEWYVKFLGSCLAATIISLVLMNLSTKFGRTTMCYYLYFIYFWTYSIFWCHLIAAGALFYKPLSPAVFNYCSWMPILFWKTIGAKQKLIGVEKLGLDSGAIVVVNHQSNCDIGFLLAIWPFAKGMVVVVKKSLLYAWPLSAALLLTGGIFIDRKNTKAAHSTLNQATQFIRAKKTKIALFPEGTRNSKAIQERRLMPFKKGPFKMAVDRQVPIIPVVTSPYYMISHQHKYCKTEDAEVVMKVLEPLETAGMTDDDVEDLMTLTQNLMQNCYTEIVQEIEAKLPQDHPYILSKKM